MAISKYAFDRMNPQKMNVGGTPATAYETLVRSLMPQERTISEYQQALEDIYKLVEEHMFLDSKKTHLNFKAGEKMKMTEFNEAINEQTAKDNEDREKIKQRIEQEE